MCVGDETLWAQEGSRTQLHLEHALHGHTDAVTYINLVVSGSKVSCSTSKVIISNDNVVVA